MDKHPNCSAPFCMGCPVCPFGTRDSKCRDCIGFPPPLGDCGRPEVGGSSSVKSTMRERKKGSPPVVKRRLRTKRGCLKTKKPPVASIHRRVRRAVFLKGKL
ncbi:hypothetical protein [Pasteuria penetrans]|uniref:hypothetical protein n=1 Tax=Pasteuria penetrans TaxID=86005 RepID=UPI000FA2D8D0|nr:hypothetical protein [Pasteuria penetrans]